MNEANVNNSAEKPRLKHGFVGPDGRIFVQYQAGGTPQWMTPEKFAERKAKQSARNKEKRKNMSPEERAAYLAKSAKWRKDNPERWKETKAACRVKRREKDLDQARKWRLKNIDKIRELDRKHYALHKEETLLKNKEWRDKNKDKINAQKRGYMKHRRKNNPMHVIQMRVRSRFANAMKRRGWSKDSPMQSIVGCSWHELVSHIESLFLPNMTWDNRDKWHIDHIVPLCTATNEEEVKRLCHWKNLQPLWIEDNLRKGGNYVRLSSTIQNA